MQHYQTFAAGSGGHYSGAKVLVDNATVYGRGIVNVGREAQGTNHVMEIVNGGRVTGIDQFHVGQWASQNRLLVDGAGSLLSSTDVYIGYREGARGNVAVVTKYIAVNDPTNDLSSLSGTLTLAGSQPRVTCANYTNKSTRLVFKVPEGGFAEGPIITATNNLCVDDSCSLEIVADHGSDKTMILMQSNNKTLSISDEVIANVWFTGKKAGLYTVMKSADGRQLLLKPRNGTLVIFR